MKCKKKIQKQWNERRRFGAFPKAGSTQYRLITSALFVIARVGAVGSWRGRSVS